MPGRFDWSCLYSRRRGSEADRSWPAHQTPPTDAQLDHWKFSGPCRASFDRVFNGASRLFVESRARLSKASAKTERTPICAVKLPIATQGGDPMAKSKTPREVNHRRRRFLGTAALTVAAAKLGVIGSATAQPSNPTASRVPPIELGTNTFVRHLKQIDAGLLNIGYAEAGPADGPPVILLHGWPYDIYSYVDVAPLLASKGYRVLVPYLRGYGTTSFKSQRHLPECSAISRRLRHHRFYGCSSDQESDHRRL